VLFSLVDGNREYCAVHADVLKSDDDIDSPEPSSAGGSIRFQTTSYSPHSERSRQPSRTSTIHTPETESTSPKVDPHLGRQVSSYDLDILPDDDAQTMNAPIVGYLGQICEAHWLRVLKNRVHLRRDSSSLHTIPQLSETNFYLDDHDIHLIEQQNPFHLPPETSATLLLRHYLQTAHITFPIVSLDIQHEIEVYYISARRREILTYPQSWFATVNLTFAIGARFARLVDEDGDPLDEIVYLSNATQLLNLNDTAMMLTTPDLPLIQVRCRLCVTFTC
jgi:hypothetical protein